MVVGLVLLGEFRVVVVRAFVEVLNTVVKAVRVVGRYEVFTVVVVARLVEVLVLVLV